MSDHTLVAKQIRAFLKEQGIVGKVKASSYVGGSCVDVAITDVDPEKYELVNEFCLKYQKGSFNVSEDLYVFHNVDKSIPQVHHVIIKRDFSDEIRQKALDVLHQYYPFEYANVTKVYAEVGDNDADADGDFVHSAIRDVLVNNSLYVNLWKWVWGN